MVVLDSDEFLTRRNLILGLSASATLFSAGCLPLLALSRVFLGRGLATAALRGAGARGAAVAHTIGRSNTIAYRAFSASRALRRLPTPEIQRYQAKEQERFQLSANQVSRAFRIARQLDRLDVRTENGDKMAEIVDTGGETIECRIASANLDIVTVEIREGELEHYDMYGSFCGRSTVDDEDTHVHFADKKRRNMIGRDQIWGGGAQHTANGSNIGETVISPRDGAAFVSSSKDLNRNLIQLVGQHSASDQEILRDGRIFRRDCRTGGNSDCALLDHLD